ncbi:MAG: hypothetical protein O1I36_16345 [Cylindrospermopsis raciborskii PAMP2011]|nr:hypothetical protein [Cylindrospermopsis raciborskii PAMP2011]
MRSRRTRYGRSPAKSTIVAIPIPSGEGQNFCVLYFSGRTFKVTP